MVQLVEVVTPIEVLMKTKPTRDDVQLVAAALGLRASAVAQAEVHIAPREFNAAINGKQVLKNGLPLCPKCNEFHDSECKS